MMNARKYKLPVSGNWYTSLPFFLIYVFILSFAVDRMNAQGTPVDGMRGPSTPVKTLSMEAYGSGNNFLLDIYQNYLSPVKGGNRCPMYPSCSQYAKILFEERPVYQAYIGTFERILRCGHELHLYPRIASDNRLLWYDPPPIEEKDDKISGSVTEELKFALSSLSDNQFSNVNSDSTEDSFADFLFYQKEYYRAATEYMRLAFYSTDSVKMADYLSRIGLCYYFGQDYDACVSLMEEHRDIFRKYESLSAKMDLMLSKTYYHLKKYQKSISTIEWSNIRLNDPLYDEAQFNMGLAYARIFQWEKASNCFSRLNPESQRGLEIPRLSDSIRIGNNLPSRQPWLAGAFSAVIPGTGYIYAGRTQTGIISFIVNGLLIWSFRDALKHESYGLASAIGFFGTGWYFGNISGSVKAVREYNEMVRNDFIDKLIENLDYEVFD